MKTEVKKVEIMFQVEGPEGRELEAFVIQELSVAELEELGRIGKACIRKEWVAQVHELAQSLNPKDRAQFLVEASRQGPDVASAYIPWVSGEQGIKTAICMSCPDAAKRWDAISGPLENAEAILQAWRIALGLPEEAVGDDSPLPEAGQ